MGKLNTIIPIIAIVVGVAYFGINDGQTFIPSSDKRPAGEAPKLVFEKGNVVNKGGQASLEDIVYFAIKQRAGSDGIVGTQDDALNLEQTFDLIRKALAASYPSAVLFEGDWLFNHNAAVTGVLQLLYADFNEYVLLFGSPLPIGGYSGQYQYDCYDYQFDKEQENFVLGQIESHLYTPNNDTTPNSKIMMVLKAGQQKCYTMKQGGWMLEYGHGNIIPALYDGVILPTVTVANDWKSFCRVLGNYAYGVTLSTLRKFGFY